MFASMQIRDEVNQISLSGEFHEKKREKCEIH